MEVASPQPLVVSGRSALSRTAMCLRMMFKPDTPSLTSGHRAATLILGIGNILLRDEGVGVHVIEAMRGRSLPESIELLDGGTSGIDLLEHIADRRKVVVVDAVDTHHKPGTILHFSAADLIARTDDSVSLHEFGLVECLTAAKNLGCEPQEVTIIGVQPKEVSHGLDLSDEVAAVLPKVIDLALAEVQT